MIALLSMQVSFDMLEEKEFSRKQRFSKTKVFC